MAQSAIDTHASTLGSNLVDYFNHIRKQKIYKRQYGVDSDLRIVDKFYYKQLPYDQVYAVLDYKRRGNLNDDITYTEIADYNETITSVPGFSSPQLVSKDVFILSVNLNMNGQGRESFSEWEITDINVYQYLGGNPRAEDSGLLPSLVVDDRETRSTRNGTRVDLKTIVRGLSVSQYMEWESDYRRAKTKEAMEVLERRDYFLGRS